MKKRNCKSCHSFIILLMKLVNPVFPSSYSEHPQDRNKNMIWMNSNFVYIKIYTLIKYKSKSKNSFIREGNKIYNELSSNF